jgi:GAF domain-containing protein
MTRRAAKVGKAATRRLRIGEKPPRAAKATRRRTPSATELQKQLTEALEQQAATSEVLKIISSSPGKLEPVFRAILKNAIRICEARFGHMLLVEGNLVRVAAEADTPPKLAELFRRRGPFEPTPGSHLDRVRRTKRISHTADDTAEAVQGIASKYGGARSIVAVPMLKDDTLIGVILIYRQEVRAFTDKQIALLQSFADQAAIAIENARLFNEAEQALERQTATAEILRVIASSPSDLQPVFEAIAARSVQLVGGHSAAVSMFVGDRVELGAITPVNPEADAGLKALYPRRLADYPLFELARGGEVTQVFDIETESRVPPVARAMARARGFRSLLVVPMKSDKGPVGVITVTRKEPGTFAANHIQLMQTFADQAVIAIKNTRLFDEVQTKTRDLQEALTYQTGSSNILRVIASSPTDVGPVLQAIVESACALCEANDAVVRLKEGDTLCLRAHDGPIPVDRIGWPISRDWTAGRSCIDRQPVHVHDMLSPEGDEFPEAQERARDQGHRTILSVPLLRKGESIGTITLRRLELNPFSDKQIALLQTFADQAVIAIGNVRLFEEVQQRTRELSESLQFQTASADVLKVISRSPDALQPVFDVIVETSQELCRTQASTIFTLRNDRFHVAAFSGIETELLQHMRDHPIAFDEKGSALARAVREKRTIHIPNTTDDPEFAEGGPTSIGGPRATLTVPLMHDRQVIGGITLRQSHLTPFTPRQIEVIESFADQAEIAISNVGLFDQVQQRTRELTKSLDDLRAAQDRLIQTEKLASLGQLTAGIAHEMKNPLNFVNNFSTLSRELVDEMNDVLKSTALDQKPREELEELTQILKSNLEKVVQHGRRADSIVKNMLLHSRQGSGEHRSAAVNALVEESLNLAYHGARAEKSGFKITLRRDLDPDAGAVEVYPQEIARALLNLISNGFYAATKRKSEADDETFEPILSAATKNLGNRVEIRIRDNGTGITPGVKDKIFNPFFTTKPAGEGTGLGLSMSHDIIVKQHGGTIDVETEPGLFTEFIITLPRDNRTAAGEKRE